MTENSAQAQRTDLETELRGIVSEVGAIPPDFNATAHFYNDLGMASVKALHLLMGLEDRYGIQIQDEDFVNATSLERLSSLVKRLLADAAQ